MGTRSLTFVYDDSKKKIINMYRQMDGYPSGHGLGLAEFITPFTIVNGIRTDETRTIANGMECLAAQLVAHFKVRVGNIYLYPTTYIHCDQDYEYHIYTDTVVVKEGYNGTRMKTIFSGSWESFKEFCEK